MERLSADLIRLVQADVRQWNEVAEGEGAMEGHTLLRPLTGQMCVVEHTAIAEPETLTTTMKLGVVTVACRAGTVTLTTRWDREASHCWLVIVERSGKSVEFPHEELAKVVQYILEPFFFPTA